MNLAPEQVEILMLESSVNSYKVFVERLARRVIQAQDELDIARGELHRQKEQLQSLRESILHRGCV